MVLRMSIGVEDSLNVEYPDAFNTISKDSRYFPDFFAYLVSFYGVAQAGEAARSAAATRYGPKDFVVFGCRASPAHWHWRPYDTIADLYSNLTPHGLQLIRKSCTPPSSPPDMSLPPALNGLLSTFGQALGTNYFERYVGIIKSAHGPNPDHWPQPWGFAWHIRNAMAHDGQLAISDIRRPPFKWQGLEYSHLQNGRRILHVDLWPGDLFDLIVEMDAALPYP